MNIGDIVVVVGSNSIPDYFFGRYGRIESVISNYKVFVEFNQRVGNVGSLAHSALTSDLIKVGESKRQ